MSLTEANCRSMIWHDTRLYKYADTKPKTWNWKLNKHQNMKQWPWSRIIVHVTLHSFQSDTVIHTETQLVPFTNEMVKGIANMQIKNVRFHSQGTWRQHMPGSSPIYDKFQNTSPTCAGGNGTAVAIGPWRIKGGKLLGWRIWILWVKRDQMSHTLTPQKTNGWNPENDEIACIAGPTYKTSTWNKMELNPCPANSDSTPTVSFFFELKQVAGYQEMWFLICFGISWHALASGPENQHWTHRPSLSKAKMLIVSTWEGQRWQTSKWVCSGWQIGVISRFGKNTVDASSVNTLSLSLQIIEESELVKNLASKSLIWASCENMWE